MPVTYGTPVASPPTGTVVATEAVSGAEYQLLKIVDGTAASTNRMIVSAAGAAKVDGSAVTQPISAAALPLPAGAAQEHTTAASPHSARLSDGAAFYDATKTGQLPGALVSGRLDVNIGAAPATLTVASHAVTNAGTFAVQDSQKVVDNAAFTDGTTPVLPTGFVFDEVAGTALTENDAAAARIDSKRAQVLVFEDATTRGQRAAISAAGAQKVEGGAASGAAVAGAPMQAGGRAATANPTAVTDGQAAYAMLDKLGKPVVVPFAPRLLTIQNLITLTATTETTLLAAAAATFHDLVLLMITNTSATAVRVDIRDTTAGTVRLSFQLPPGTTLNSNIVVEPASPIEQAAVNTNWTAQLSAAVTDVRIFAKAVKLL